MSFDEFLVANRNQIMAESEKRVLSLAALRPTSEQMKKGLPIFFEKLVEVLKKRSKAVSTDDEVEISDSAGEHGKELLRLGYTLTHVVHCYGAMCQAITEVASLTNAPVTAMDFHNMNRCLDIAIAGAVTEFESLRNFENKNREVVHLGAIAHELRNALNRARISFEMLVKGVVGVGGSTSRVLGRSLEDMDLLINKSLCEVRLRADHGIHEEYFKIFDVVSDLFVTAGAEAQIKKQILSIYVDHNMSVKTDRNLIAAAIGNLIQNAFKFTKCEGTITVAGWAEDLNVFVTVKDQCGGIPVNKMNELFKPFAQQDKDRSGLGLGLVISREAIEKCGGTLTLKNSGDGCTFTASLPRYFHVTTPIQKSVV